MSASELPGFDADRSPTAGWSSPALRVAVVGGGYMGGGIAQTFALNGFDCVIADVDAARADALVADLKEQARRYEDLGLFPAGAAASVATHLHAAPSPADAVRDAGYVVEAVPERAELKHAVLQQISELAPGEAILTTNTSAIPITELSRSVRHPERFLGAHWMNPAPFVPCVEVIPTLHTADRITDSVFALLAGIGKAPTRVADAPGFVANRLQFALFKECARLVEENVATPAEVDEVVRNSFGFRLPFFGPFAIADVAGLDVYAGSFPTLERAYGDRLATPESLQRLVSAGQLGVKSGAGYYTVGDGGAEQVAMYRDRAYAGLTRLRQDLGDDGLLAPVPAADPVPGDEASPPA